MDQDAKHLVHGSPSSSHLFSKKWRKNRAPFCCCCCCCCCCCRNFTGHCMRNAPSVNVLLRCGNFHFFSSTSFHWRESERERERLREMASTEEPRDRFGDIGWRPQLFATFTLALLLHTQQPKYVTDLSSSSPPPSLFSLPSWNIRSLKFYFFIFFIYY